MNREDDIKRLEDDIRTARAAGAKIVQGWQTYAATCAKEIAAVLKKVRVFETVNAIEVKRNRRKAEADAALAPINKRLGELNFALEFARQREAEERSQPITCDAPAAPEQHEIGEPGPEVIEPEPDAGGAQPDADHPGVG